MFARRDNALRNFPANTSSVRANRYRRDRGGHRFAPRRLHITNNPSGFYCIVAGCTSRGCKLAGFVKTFGERTPPVSNSYVL